MTHSFHSRVLLVFIGLIVLTQAGTTAGMYFAAKRTAYGLADQQLQITERLLQDTLGARDHEYRLSLQALAADFAFRAAVSSKDGPMLASALTDHGARLGADVALLLNGTGRIVASTDASFASTMPEPVKRLLNEARLDSSAPVIADFNGKLMQFVVVPVRAPDTIGWVGMGFELRDFVVDHIKAVSGADITLISQTRDGAPSVAVTTVPASQRAALDGRVRANLDGHNSDEYRSRMVAVAGLGGSPLFAILQLPERTVAAPFSLLRQDLFWWAGPVTVLCLIAAIFCARFLALPVQTLAATARHLTASKRGDVQVRKKEDDVSSLTGAFHTLAHRTQYDALTGLPNRTLFVEWLSAGISRADRENTPLSVVFLDLDGFRNINDVMGRATGDLVLRKTAQRLLRCLRESDVVARLAADEFVLILDGVSQLGALQIVDRLMPVVSRPMESPHGPIRVTMRAGIAVYPDHARDRESLLNLADAAKHETKTRKRATVVARAPTGDTSSSMSLSTSNSYAMSSSDTWSGAAWHGDDLSTQPIKKIDAE